MPLEQLFDALHAVMLRDPAGLLIAVVWTVISEPADGAGGWRGRGEGGVGQAPGLQQPRVAF